MNLACLDWLLPMPIHAFVSASETVLKALVAEVTGGHRIVARIQNIPGFLRGEQDYAIPWPPTPEVFGQPAIGRENVQKALKPVGRTD